MLRFTTNKLKDCFVESLRTALLRGVSLGASLGVCLAVGSVVGLGLTVSEAFAQHGTVVNSSVLNPGDAGTIGVIRYGRYVNYAQGKTTEQISTYPNYPANLAVDGNTSAAYSTGSMNFSHTAETGEPSPWWEVNYASTATGLSKMVVYNRAGFEGRLTNFTVQIYDGKPGESGSALVDTVNYTSGNFTGLTELTLDSSKMGTWLRVTNNTPNQVLALPETLLFANDTDVGGYGNTATGDGNYYWGTELRNTSSGTLSIDCDFSSATPSFDLLDVGGTFTAGGTLQFDLIGGTNISAGEYQFVKAGAYAGSFTSVVLSSSFLSLLSSNNLVQDLSKVASEGKLILTTGDDTKAYWRSEASANADFAAAENWRGTLSNNPAFFGRNAGETVSAVLTSNLTLGALTMGEGGTSTLSINAGGVLTLNTPLKMGLGGSADTKIELNGGSFTTPGGVSLGNASGTTSKIVVNSGTLTLNAGENSFGRVGGSRGELTVNGGSATVNKLQLGYDSNSVGVVLIEGGDLSIVGESRIGKSGNGTITQNGGTVVSGNMYMGDDAGGTGTITLNGGTWTSTGNMAVGVRGSGTLNVNGTALMKAPELNVGFAASDNASGTVNQTGGTVEVTRVLFGTDIYQASCTGTYNLKGGVLKTDVVRFGTKATANAQFNVSGGTAEVKGEVSVPTTISSGNLTANAITGASFTQLGGHVTVNTLSSANATVSGGTLTADVVTSGLTMSGASTLAPGGIGTIGTTTLSGESSFAKAGSTTNIALNKTASQPSTLSTFVASRAVDGSLNNFAHTAPSSGTDQWWQVDLGGMYPISAIKLYNRADYEHRLVGNGNGYHFELYDGSFEQLGELLWTSEVYTTYTRPQTINLPVGTAGNVLRLVRDFGGNVPVGDDLTLNLSELEVYSVETSPIISMDIASDTQHDMISLTNDAELDLTNAILSLNFLEGATLNVGDSFQLFDLSSGGTLTGELSGILSNLELPPGMFLDTRELLATGILTLQVPEPATWLLLVFGLGMIPLSRLRVSKD